MKISFRCKASGNIVSFTDNDNIESMRKEAHYEEVKDVVHSSAQDVPAQIIQEQEIKRRGRHKMVI